MAKIEEMKEKSKEGRVGLSKNYEFGFRNWWERHALAEKEEMKENRKKERRKEQLRNSPSS